MGIRSKFDGDFKAIDLAGMADDMLAQVVADHAADQFRTSNRANAAVAGGYVPYKVELNGRTVHRGQGDILPQQQIALAINPPGRAPVRVSTRLPIVGFSWSWESLQGNALERALTELVRLNTTVDKVLDPFKFERMLLQATSEPLVILNYLLKRYARSRYPKFFQRLDEAKALYRVYRIISIGSSLLGVGGRDQQTDPSVLAWIARELRARSPVQSGGYRDAHELWGDGEMLMGAADVTDDARIPDAEEFSFTNTVPYSRKIEIGKTKSGRDFVVQVENHVYERVAKDAAERFRGLAEISFEFRPHEDGYTLRRNQTARSFLPGRVYHAPGQRPDRTAGSGLTYPTIVVRFK